MIQYLLICDSLIENLDFVLLNSGNQTLETKMLNFNRIFKVVPLNQTDALCREISELMSQEYWLERNPAKQSSLNLWSLIEKTTSTQSNEIGYKHVSDIMKTVHALPTSSANVEQSFSRVKCRHV